MHALCRILLTLFGGEVVNQLYTSVYAYYLSKCMPINVWYQTLIQRKAKVRTPCRHIRTLRSSINQMMQQKCFRRKKIPDIFENNYHNMTCDVSIHWAMTNQSRGYKFQLYAYIVRLKLLPLHMTLTDISVDLRRGRTCCESFNYGKRSYVTINLNWYRICWYNRINASVSYMLENTHRNEWKRKIRTQGISFVKIVFKLQPAI